MRTDRLSFLRNAMQRPMLLAAVLMLAGCTGIPEGVTPVSGFKVDRYLGTWYEIARLDHSFERGLVDVSANYQAKPDGGINVLNRGYDPAKKLGAKQKASPISSAPRIPPA